MRGDCFIVLIASANGIEAGNNPLTWPLSFSNRPPMHGLVGRSLRAGARATRLLLRGSLLGEVLGRIRPTASQPSFEAECSDRGLSERKQLEVMEFLRSTFLTGSVLSDDGSLRTSLGDAIDRHQLTGISHYTFLQDLSRTRRNLRLLDFGCGTGRNRHRCEALGYSWHGVDIPDSIESKSRTEHHERVTLYDGLTLPFDDRSFDVILADQTLEHIQDPNETFSELARVLRPGGHLIGSVSHLEPFHSNSTFNFTPYGFKIHAERFGFKLRRVHPGIDAWSLVTRRLMMQTRQKNALKYLTDTHHDGSLGNRLLISDGQRRGLSTEAINSLRLLFCGVFRFDAELVPPRTETT